MTEAPDSIVAAIDKLFAAASRGDAPGYVVGVARDDKLLYRRAFGLASLEHAVANTPATRMRIGSTTKHFTALAVLLLVEDGKVELDQPLRRYLPEFEGPTGSPTLRQLLAHTGGLYDPLAASPVLTEGLFPKLRIQTIFDWSRRMTATAFAPGARWRYSNHGYNLLSLLIERVSGKSLAAFFRERLFAPLGMSDTELVPDDLSIVPGLATFHVPNPGGGYIRGIYPCDLLGGGGIVSTVDDMLRWMSHLRRPGIVGSAATWVEFQRRPRFNSGAESEYCMGLQHQSDRGTEILHHAGATMGATCMLLAVPQHALDIIIMSNRKDSDPAGLSMKIAQAVLGEALRPAPTPARAAGREALLGRYYSPRSKLLLGISAHDDKLAFSVAGPLVGIFTEAEGVLTARYSGIGPVALRHEAPPAGGVVATVEFENCGVRETFERLPEAAPTTESLAAEIAGRYELADFGTPVDLILEQGVLYIDLRSRYQSFRLRLQPLSREVLGFSMLYFGAPGVGSIALERAPDGTVSGFFLSTDRAWNLRFNRGEGSAPAR